MGQLTARIANIHDYARIARLCRRAVGPSDYVLAYLRSVIPAHGLFLALQNNQLVGMTNFEKCIDGSGWMGMARTDPSWRRRGVAIFLQKTIAKHAMSNGIRTIRLWTLSKNKPALNALLKGGYRPICKAVHVSKQLRTSNVPITHSPAKSIPVEFADSILESEYVSEMNGYMPYKWHIVRPDRKVLRYVAKKGEYYRNSESAFLLSIPDYAAWEGTRLHNEFTLLVGPSENLFQSARETARSRGVAFLGGYIPYDKRLLSKAESEGFQTDSWADHCIVFEKRMR